MRLVCANEEWLSKYEDLCFHRKLPFKPWPSRLALLAAMGRDLIAGVMVYDSSGPFLHFQHLVTNETAPLRWRWAAVDLMASEIPVLCRHLNKLPMVLVEHKGIARILKKHGLQDTRATNFSCHYSQLERHDYETTEEHPRGIQNPKPARRIQYPPEEDNPPLRPAIG